MLFKLSLVFIMILTVSLVTYNYASNIFGNLKQVVNISDDDVAKANGELNKKGEIVIDDGDFKGELKAKQTSSRSREDEAQVGQDGSEVVTMYDGYGNKTETRAFTNHNRLKMIVVRTDTRGMKRVFVYGQNGKVKSVPPNMLDTVLQTSPDEVANAAQIYETKADRERRKEEVAQRKRDLRQKAVEDTEFPVVRQPGFDQSPVNNETPREGERNQISENQQSPNEER